MSVKFDASGMPVLSAFMRSNARRRVITGPFGSAKSSGCCIEIPRRAAMHPHYTDGFRHTRFLITRNTTPQLRDTTMKTFFRWFPNGSIGEYRSTERVYYVKMGDIRSEIIFRALDNPDDVSNLLSLEITGAWMNECREIAPDIVDGIDGRLGRWYKIDDAWCGMMGDTNPPIEQTYWDFIISGCDPETEELVDDNGWTSFRQPSGLSPEAENLENLPGGREYYTKMMQGKTPNYIRMYVNGLPGRSVAGKPVFPTYNPDWHLSKTPLILQPKRDLLLTFDFGLTPACVFQQQDVHGRVLSQRELVTLEKETSGLQRFLKEKVKPMLNSTFPGYKLAITGDPSGGIGSQNDEQTCVDIFIKEGFPRKIIQFAKNNEPQPRREATEYFLGNLTSVGPAYLIDPSCRYLSRGMGGGYHYPLIRAKGQTADKPAKNLSSHICEAAEYGCMRWQAGLSSTAVIARNKAWLEKIANQSSTGYHAG